MKHPFHEVTVQCVAGLVAAAAGDLGEAAQHLREASVLADRNETSTVATEMGWALASLERAVRGGTTPDAR